MSNGKTLQGGRRPGSGRKRMGKERRVSLSLSVDADTKRKYKNLRNQGLPVEPVITAAINKLYDTFFTPEAQRILEILEK